ncbi:MAG: SGNH/GDSL hydrolase family protein [Myxococcales bacterium]
MKNSTRTGLTCLVLVGFTACSSDAPPNEGGGAGASSSPSAGASSAGSSPTAGAPSAGAAGSLTAGANAGGTSGSGAGGATAGSLPNAGAGGAQTAGSGGAGGGAAGGGAAGGGAAGGGAAGGGAAGGGSGGSTHTGSWRITPLGDSITGTTCGPQLLSKKLKDNSRSNFSFIGTNLNNQSCNGAPNVQTEGHGGYLVTDLVGNGKHASELGQWTSADKPDVVLMHFGTNDVWNNIAPATILDAYSTVLSSLRSASPKVIVFVAQIIPMNPDGCAACESRVEALNAQIPAWASSKSTATSPIYVVDQHSAFVASTYKPSSMYTSDGVHPNVAGGQLMADKWYAALTAKGIP